MILQQDNAFVNQVSLEMIARVKNVPLIAMLVNLSAVVVMENVFVKSVSMGLLVNARTVLANA